MLISIVFFQGSYTSLPSLKPYIDLLSPTVSSKGIFDILGNSDKEEYYDELLCYIEILSAALTDIERYTQKEKSANRGAARTSILDSPSKMRERSDLDMLKRLLDLLHGKIGEYFAFPHSRNVVMWNGD